MLLEAIFQYQLFHCHKVSEKRKCDTERIVTRIILYFYIRNILDFENLRAWTLVL